MFDVNESPTEIMLLFSMFQYIVNKEKEVEE